MFASAERIELAALWDELLAGTCKIDGWSHCEDTWSMVVSCRPGPPPTASVLRERDVEILQHALLCGVRKLVAVEAGLSCSSIAVILQSCFQFMGLSCLPSRIPGLLVAAAHARHHQGPKFRASLRTRGEPSFAQRNISVTRPDRALAAWLAPAEHAVITLLIEGQTYAEIAQLRQTSLRTVANQVASGFRRLGVSGRAELLCLIARWGLARTEPPPRRPPAVVSSRDRRRDAPSFSLLQEAAGPPQCLSPSHAT